MRVKLTFKAPTARLSGTGIVECLKIIDVGSGFESDGNAVPVLFLYNGNVVLASIEQEAQLMLTTGSTRLAVSRGQQTWYHFRSIATFR